MTILPLAADSVAVKVMFDVPALPSTSETSLITIEANGSSSVIVPIPWLSAIVTFTGTVRFTKNVSSISSKTSPTIGTEIVFVTCPGRNVSVPEVEV